VEHRITIARAANTGVSAFVSPAGRITRLLPLFERGVLTAPLELRRRTTLYTRWGDWLAYACLGLSAVGLGVPLFRRSGAGC
jgi:apolipoprotein N-acyltransferase